MVDVMEERVRSVSSTAGVAFALGALCLSISILLYPALPPANETSRILEVLLTKDTGGWMWLHAFMTLGFVLATIGFVSLAFLLHLRGSSGPASAATTCALIGGTLWVGFLSAEYFVHPFIKNLAGIDPGLATMLFNTYWFWKMGALWAAGILFFIAVIAAGLAAHARGILPAWLGWGGAGFAVLGLLVYLFDFMHATTIGAAINPMRSGIGRWGVGLPLQLWMIGTGAMLLREYRERVTTLPPQFRTPVPRREDRAPHEGEILKREGPETEPGGPVVR